MWRDLVPRSLHDNLRWRYRLWGATRDEQWGIWNACREDIEFFVDSFVWTVDPRRQSSVVPFILWDYQREALSAIQECLLDGRSVVIEKSRDMGATWTVLVFLTWLWLFHEDRKILCISRDEESVEKLGDPDSLFWKIDFMLEGLPSWLLRGYTPEYRKRKLFAHPVTRSVISGQASTERAGVGGRATVMFLDEFSQVRDAREVLRRTAGTTNCRIFTGTHKGTGTVFHELTNPNTVAGSMVRKIVMHWSQHPEKRRGLYRWDGRNVVILDTGYRYPPDFRFVTDGTPSGGPYPGVRSPWYDRKAAEIGDPIGVAEDLDINPSGSTATLFDALHVAQLLESACRPVWEGVAEYSSDGYLRCLRQMKDGPLKLWRHLDGSQLSESVYCGGADISEGVGSSPTCFSFADAKTGEKVLEYTNARIDPSEAAVLVAALCRWLYDALFCWENHGPGRRFGIRLAELGVNMYREKDQVGWYPSADAKDLLLREYREHLYSRRFVNYSEAALKECLNFEMDSSGHYRHSCEKVKTNPYSASINHGDHVIADALCARLVSVLNMASGRPKADVIPINSLAWRRMVRHEARVQEVGY